MGCSSISSLSLVLREELHMSEKRSEMPKCVTERLPRTVSEAVAFWIGCTKSSCWTPTGTMACSLLTSTCAWPLFEIESAQRLIYCYEKLMTLTIFCNGMPSWTWTWGTGIRLIRSYIRDWEMCLKAKLVGAKNHIPNFQAIYKSCSRDLPFQHDEQLL